MSCGVCGVMASDLHDCHQRSCPFKAKVDAAPRERVMEARDAVYGLIHAGFADELAIRDLDALIAAVRAATLAEVREKLAVLQFMPETWSYGAGWNGAIEAAHAILTELEAS